MNRIAQRIVASAAAGFAFWTTSCGGSGGGGGPPPPPPPTFAVTAPNGGETFGAGFPMTIRWTPVLGLVDIDYSTDRGATWTKLVNSVPGGGVLTFTAPNVSTFQARIRVSQADGDPAVVTEPSDFSDADFTIGPPLVDTGVPLQGVAGCDFAWGDYDGDGDLDLAMCGVDTAGIFTPHTKVYRNDFGTFTDVAAPLPGVYNGALAWGDVDGDGDLDLALLGGDTSGTFFTRVFRNDAGTFVDLSAPLLPMAVGALAWGDVDGDGDLDLVTAGLASTGGSATRVYLNTGGALADSGLVLPGVSFCALALGDVDGDGDLDLVFSGNSSGLALTRVYRNDGGVFTDSGARPIDLQQGALALGDYDHDGDLDLAICGQTAAGVRHFRVYRNAGGAFVDAGAGLAGLSDGGVAWGDLDGDGDLDLVVTGSPTGAAGVTRVLRSDGGTFVDPGAGLLAVSSSGLALGDFDGDGRLDLVVGGSTGITSATRLYQNVGSLADTAPTAPTGLTAYPFSDGAVFTCIPATDLETSPAGLSYNLRVTELPTYREVFPGMALGSGRRLLPQAGVVRPHDPLVSWGLTLPSGVYLVAVQAVDASLEGGPWSDEVLFVVP